MQRLLFLGLLCIFNGSVHANTPPLRVMSFNLRFDAAEGATSDKKNAWQSTSGKHRRNLALQVIRDYDPDILGVQEALTNQVTDIQRALPTHDYYGVGRDDGSQRGEYACVFYRKDRFANVRQGTFWLSEHSDQPGSKFPKTCCARIASWVVLQDRADHDREYLLLNTHWDHQFQAARLFSAERIRQFLPTIAESLPIVLMGDLNAKQNNPAYHVLVGSDDSERLGLLDSFREVHPQPEYEEGTYHGMNGRTDGARIDYIFHSSEFRATAAEIVRTHDGKRYPSDHYPVTATLVPQAR